MNSPRLWWPVNKGPQNLYDLKLTVSVDGVVCDSVKTRFGIREITSDTNTPDKSRVFYVNGKRSVYPWYELDTGSYVETLLMSVLMLNCAIPASRASTFCVCGEVVLPNLTISSSLCDETGFAGMAGILDDRGYSSSS